MENLQDLLAQLLTSTSKHTIETIGKTEKMVYGDKDRLGQVIINLLTNAIKYLPAADKIIVKSTVEQDCVTLCVQDFGMGIPKEKQHIQN